MGLSRVIRLASAKKNLVVGETFSGGDLCRGR